jgi:integrase
MTERTPRRTRRANLAGSSPYRHGQQWAVKITVYDDLGKSRRKPIYGATPELAKKNAAAALEQLEAGSTLPEHITLGQYLQIWITDTVPAQLANRVITQATADSYTNETRNHLIPDLGHITLLKLNAPQVRRWMAWKRTQTSVRKKPYSLTAVRYYQTVLRRALGDAIRDEIYGVTTNVAVAEKVGRAKRSKAHKGKPLTTAELARLMPVIAGDPKGPLWLTFLAIGARKAQVVDMPESGLRLDEGRAWLPPSKDWSGEEEPEGRWVSLPPTLVEVLRQHLAAQRKLRAERKLAGQRWVDTDLVFTTRYGTRLFERNLNRDLTTLLAKAGIRLCAKCHEPHATEAGPCACGSTTVVGHHTIHDFRHTRATHGLRAGEEPKAVQDLLGHSRLGTTTDIYMKVLDEMQRQSADLMNVLMVDKWGLDITQFGSK